MKTRTLLSLLAGYFLSSIIAPGHCQVPCGIYADEVVFGELATDVATIRKAMTEINTLAAPDNGNPNQLVRWVNNKEAHAGNIQATIASYFLAQRIKMGLKDDQPERYARLLELAHRVTVLAMKCKQGTDSAQADALEEALGEFRAAYEG
ncbi:MAG: superoxide dismutase [Ni] [Opitutales bacterium]|jgi:nickel superoxide dismutase